MRVSARGRRLIPSPGEGDSGGIPPGGGFLIRDGERWRFAMAIPLRSDFDAAALRAAARRTKDAAQARRLLAPAAVHDGASRAEAAKVGGVTPQIVRDRVPRFDAEGPDGLIDRKAPGQPSRPSDARRAAPAAAIGSGPTPALHGVVRRRLVDLCRWLREELRATVAEQTPSRELRAMGCRKPSARPRHHARAGGATALFRRPSPPGWRRSRARRGSSPPRWRSGSPTRPARGGRTRSPAAGRSAAPDRPPRTTGARRRPASSAPSAPRTARPRASFCPTATSARWTCTSPRSPPRRRRGRTRCCRSIERAGACRPRWRCRRTSHRSRCRRSAPSST